MLLTFLSGTLPAVSLAQSTGEPLSREQAVRLFLERNPQIQAARLEVERARADRVGAGLRPNPELNVTAENVRLAGETPFGQLYEVSASYSETIELGGKRRLRGAVADLALSAADTRLSGILRSGVFQVERLYLEAVLARKLRDVALQTQAAIAQLVASSEARFEEGAVSEGDLIRIRLEAVRVDAAVRDAELALRKSMIRLTEQLGGIDFERWQVADTLDVFAEVPELASLVELALAGRGELLAAQVDLDRSEQDIALERARAVPDIHPFVGYKRVASSDTLLFGVSIPLGFRDRNQDGIARAVADQRIAEARLAAVRNRVMAEVESAWRAWESARDRVARFEEGLLLQADDAREIALVSYEEGVSELIALLDAERVRADMQTAYFEALFDFGVSILELERAVGRDIEP